MHKDILNSLHIRIFLPAVRICSLLSVCDKILSKYVEKANENGGHISEKISPHCLRHSKAMHMVEAGINLIYIRDFLGHESIETTQVYAKANPEIRRKAIEKMESKTASISISDWNENPDIMSFLHSLR